MAGLYAATGDGFARLDEAGEKWTVDYSMSGSGAQCLAVDPADPDTVFVGMREGGVHRSDDGGRSWMDCKLPEPGVLPSAQPMARCMRAQSRAGCFGATTRVRAGVS